MKKKIRDELIQLGNKIVSCENKNEEWLALIKEFNKKSHHPFGGGMLIFHEEDESPVEMAINIEYNKKSLQPFGDNSENHQRIEAVVDKCLTYNKGIKLKLGSRIIILNLDTTKLKVYFLKKWVLVKIKLRLKIN